MRKNILKTKLNYVPNYILNYVPNRLGKANLSKTYLAKTKFFSIFLLVVVSLPLVNTHTASAATPNDVIINEIMYNPGTGNQNDEFIELYNTTGSSIDLGGWSFSAGITLTTTTFNAGTIIPSNGYLVVSPNIAQTLTTYGVVSSAEYAPTNLSNGGETVTLIDDSSNVISSVDYDDASPWPTSPDGNGPSLELKDPGLDNTDPANWGASLSSGGTPLANNSLNGIDLPVITGVNDPNGINANDPVDITATVTGSGLTSIQLSYKLNFDTDINLTMYDDGSHNDGAAGDDVYGAQIPGQPIKTLVRFKVTATNIDGTTTSPSSDDSMNYHGYYVKDPSVTSNAPILEWFIDDVDYDDLHQNHVGDKVYVPSVIVYGDDVYDNSLVRIKGEYSLSFPKKGYKVKLPSGYSIAIDGGSGRQLNEFHLNSNQSSEGVGEAAVAWHAAEVAGIKVPDVMPARLERNGEFEGLYIFADKYEGTWRAEYGYNDGELYEDLGDIVNGANNLDNVLAWNSSMKADRNDPVLRESILDEDNLPAMFNVMSVFALANSHDHALVNNSLQYKSNSTGRWEIIPWDMDLIMQNQNFMISPMDGPVYFWWQDESPTIAIYEQKDLRELYFRRLRTLVDKLYGNNELLNLYNSTNSTHSVDIALDNIKWPSSPQLYRGPMNDHEVAIKHQRYSFLAHHRQPWALPPAQTQSDRESVSFDQVVADNNNANEYIRLTNSANTAVDLSNWTIEGINYTIPAGAVIPANGVIYILRDDINYRAAHPSVLVAGQYDNDLGSSGNLTLKTDTGDTIDTRSY